MYCTSPQPCSPLPCCMFAGNTTYQRISGSLLEGTDDEERDARPMGIKETLWWFASWMIPGMGMFLEVGAWQSSALLSAAYTADLLPPPSRQSGARQAPSKHATAACWILGSKSGAIRIATMIAGVLHLFHRQHQAAAEGRVP